MIFVSVGTQLPFERLIKAVDQWSQQHPDVEVFAQIGDTQYRPQYMHYVTKLTPQQYVEKFDLASVVVSHVGMGTIIKGLENAKPLVLMPRVAAMGEHRSDHQLSTAKKFARFDLIDIVTSELELAEAISRHLVDDAVRSGVEVQTSPELIEKLRSFVEEG